MRKQKVFLFTFYMMRLLALRTEDQLEYLKTPTQENICYELCCKTQDSKTLKECFTVLSHKERIKLFDTISLENKEKFLNELGLFEYEEFLNNFSEHDWARILKKIPQNKKNLWTKKIKKQRIIINKIYQEARKKVQKNKDR